MKLNLQNTARGLIPMYDDDYDEKKRLKIGEVYRVEIKLYRNYQFHRKYFALLNCAWEYLTEKQQQFIKSKDGFRKTLQIEAGWYNPTYSIKRKEFIEESKSIAFDEMDEAEFETLYNAVKDVLFATFLRDISEDEFMRNLANF